MAKRFLFMASLFVFTTAMYAAETEINPVDQAIIDLGIDVDMKSDPQMAHAILKDDMFLHQVPGIKKILGKKLTTPMSMKPLFMDMRKSILEKHPAIVEFLRQAHQHNLLKAPDPDRMKRMFNHMFIFEDIVKGMAKDWRLMAAVHKAFLNKRSTYGIGEGKLETAMGIYNAGGGMFGAAKAITMDSVLSMYVDIRSRGSITPEEKDARSKGLMVNIMEAYLTDKARLNLKNAAAGFALTVVPPADVCVAGEEIRVEYHYSLDWTRMYHTWNLAFIIGNLDNLHLLLPKLLIPAVMDARSNDYLFMRSLALWTSLNFSLFAKLEQRENVDMPGATEIATLWGKINKDYAKAYLESISENNMKARALLVDFRLKQSIESAFGYIKTLGGVLMGQ